MRTLHRGSPAESRTYSPAQFTLDPSDWQHMSVRRRRVLIGVAFAVGALVGLFWIFMLGIAAGLYTEFTPATRILSYCMCPFLQATWLFPGAWILVIVSNACLYSGVVLGLCRWLRQ